jgi:L-aminopeptidase/D-esterase-like protein
MVQLTERPRARDAGIRIGALPCGAHNAITDVPGVRVGHVTLNYGDGALRIGHGPVRTGVTAIVPPGDDWYAQPVEAGHFIFNGAGSSGGHGSGDYVIAFSTTYRETSAMPVARDTLANDESALDVAFEAVADAPEEAILNSMFRAHTVIGRDGNTRHALPLDVVIERLRSAGRL